MAVQKNFGVTNHNAIDAYVGQRLRLLRTQRGMTQCQLGQLLGITFQQVQKYERGTNRISASRLWDLAQSLGVRIEYFFDEMAAEVMDASPAKTSSGAPVPEPHDFGLVTRRETLELNKAYYKISDPKVRKMFTKMLRAIGDMAE